MELHQLQYVIQVAEYLNFSRAAERLCVTQPTLSHQISKLEDEFGVTLFERKTRSVKLTPAGEKFVEQAKKVMAELDILRSEMQMNRSVGSGNIRIGLPAADAHGMAACVSAFRRSYPGIQLKIVENAGSEELIKLLLTGNVDIACVLPLPDKDYGAQIEFYPLISGELMLITSKQHRFAQRKHIKLAEAAQEYFVFAPVTHSMYIVALNACRRSGFEPRIACECAQLNNLLSFVAKGLGISFVSSQFVNSLPPDIRVISFEPAMERTVALAVMKNKHQMPVVSVFRDFVLQAFRSAQ